MDESSKPVYDVFVSSPGDVKQEREIANDVIARLANRFAYYAEIKPYLWETEPLLGNRGPFPDAIPNPAASDIFIMILWSRLGVDLPDEPRFLREDGQPLTGTEWEFLQVRAARRDGRKFPALLLYRKEAPTSVPAERPLKQRAIDQLQRLEHFYEDYVVDSEGRYLTASRSFTTQDQFRTILQNDLHKLIRERLNADSPRFRASRTDGDVWDTREHGPPYPGSRPYECVHALVFFGRRADAKTVIDRLKQRSLSGQPNLLVAGASGIGKTSLIQAAVRPALTQSHASGDATAFRWCDVDVSADPQAPLLTLAASLTRDDCLPEIMEHEHARTHAQLRDLMHAAPKQAAEIIDNALATASDLHPGADADRTNLLIYVDAIDVLFRLVPPDQMEALALFLRQTQTYPRIWCLATIRSDHLPDLQAHPHLEALFSDGILNLAPPGRDHFEQILRRPAALAGLSMEQKDTGQSVERELLQALDHEPYALPFLQLTLSQLFAVRTGDGILRLDDLLAVNGLPGVILASAEHFVTTQLTPAERELLPAVLIHLVSTDIAGTRVVADWRPKPDSLANGKLARILDKLILARLVVSGSHLDAPALRLTHSSLLRDWTPLAQVVQNKRTLIETRSKLERFLYSDPQGRLSSRTATSAADLAAQEPAAFSDSVHALLRRSSEPPSGRWASLFRPRAGLFIGAGVIALLVAVILFFISSSPPGGPVGLLTPPSVPSPVRNTNSKKVIEPGLQANAPGTNSTVDTERTGTATGLATAQETGALGATEALEAARDQIRQLGLPRARLRRLLAEVRSEDPQPGIERFIREFHASESSIKQRAEEILCAHHQSLCPKAYKQGLQ
ncbi:ATP-binding protein [uncultured Thiohalocapsa sp.]|uniref:ATP-binding protein n=1 Tax=uncultured Thiohalocapsa sp. TaxID=768990 RepID=UPI0025CE04E3|nr:ATP-binding protein [uncultured Thiohalocapsa sp.]